MLLNIIWTYNLQANYIGEDITCMGILVVTAFGLCYMQHLIKVKSSVQLIVGRDLVILIKHIEDCKLVYQKNQAHSNYDNNYKIENMIFHNYQVGDMVMLRNKKSYK